MTIQIHEGVGVHEHTLQALARGEVKPPPRRRRKGQTKATPVLVSRVHPLVMAEARAIIAHGTYTRLEILSSTTVRVV